jgi:peroxiredoxin
MKINLYKDFPQRPRPKGILPMQEVTQNSPNKKVQYIILCILLVFGVGVLVLLQTKHASVNSPAKPSFGKGARAPNFTLPDLNGKMVSLADHAGQVVLLNIWATWCPPCIAEMPSMEKLHQELKNENFKLLAVSIDSNGAKAVASFMAHYKLTFDVLTDTQGSIKSLYRTTGIPETFIIDKNGMIVESVMGSRDWATSEAIQFFRHLIEREMQ